MTFELSLLLKTTVLLGAGLIAVRFAHRMRASRRHLIVASTFAALAGLPLASTFGPAVGVSLPVVDTPIMAPAVAPPVAAVEMTRVTPARGEVVNGITRLSWPAPRTIVRGLWALGTAGILTAFAVALARLRRLRRSGVPWIQGQTVADAMATQAGIRRPITVMLHERIAVPATLGIVRPTILLPLDAPHWSAADLQRTFVHELEHVRRGDCWIHLAARAVCGAYWFHPLIWIAWRQLGIEAERACDDAVVGATDHTDYADQLVALAARMSTPHPHTMLSMANSSDLSVRVHAILNPHQRRGRPGVVAATSIMTIVTLSVGTVASLRAVAVPRDVGVATMREAATIGVTLPAFGFTAPVAIPQTPAAIRTVTVPPVTQIPATTLSASALITPEEYVVGPDDVLLVTFWANKDMSAEVVVRPDGKITLPLINDIAAAGSTLDQLRAMIASAAQRYLDAPQVTVVAKAINSRKVFLVGEVTRPGAYALTGPMTVLQLVATAGGLKEVAKRDSLFILRTVAGKNVRLPFDYAALLAGQSSAQDILLLPGDTVVVPLLAQSAAPWIHITSTVDARMNAGIEITKTEPYEGGPSAAVPAQAAPGARLGATRFTVRAWKEGDATRVVVYAMLPQASDQPVREVQIRTLAMRPSDSVEVTETARYGAIPVKVTMAAVVH